MSALLPAIAGYGLGFGIGHASIQRQARLIYGGACVVALATNVFSRRRYNRVVKQKLAGNDQPNVLERIVWLFGAAGLLAGVVAGGLASRFGLVPAKPYWWGYRTLLVGLKFYGYSIAGGTVAYTWGLAVEMFLRKVEVRERQAQDALDEDED